MATKIRRCLFIGLGGTGMNSILHTKKMFIDTYGEVPPMVGFLGIDTDGGAYTKELDSVTGKKVRLTPNEQFPISVDSPRDIYQTNIEHFSWVSEKNVYALATMVRGAGQVRSNGRFALTVKEASVSQKIKSAVDAITNANIMDNANYALLSDEVEFHIAFSVCGGTGAGTFINLAYLCKKHFPDYKVVGYAVLPDVFESFLSVGVARVKPNAYGAIKDLDFLMHLHPGDGNNIEFDYINHTDRVNTRPFDAIFLIDNKNDNGDTYQHVDQLTEMISLAMVTSSGELSTAAASTTDNVEKNISNGTMDIENKRAWASGLGVSEIIYSGRELARLYALKAARRYISCLKNNTIDAESKAAGWIDSPDVNIRENNNFDNLIDYLLSKAPRTPIDDISDKDNARPECDIYINHHTDTKEVEARLRQKLDTVLESFHNLVVDSVNQDGGVGNSIDLINSIRQEIDIFMGEMRDELTEWQSKEATREVALKTAIDDLARSNSKTVNHLFGSAIKDATNEVLDSVRNLTIAKREVIRRNTAIIFYTSLLSKIDEEQTKVENLDSMLTNVSSVLSAQISSVQNSVGNRSKTFQIDLSAQKAASINVMDEDVMVNQFVNNLSTPNKLYDYANLSNEDFIKVLYEYTSGLNGAQVLASTTVDKAMNSLSNEDFDRLMTLALNKAKVLMRTDYRGHMPMEQAADCYYVGVADKENSRLRKNDALRNHLASSIVNVDFANIGMDDRVIIYHQCGVVPAYAVTAIPTYKNAYEQMQASNNDSHFDSNIEQMMERQHFDIFPQKKLDDSVQLWVLGFIFGFIKNEGETYKVKNTLKGDPLDDYWYTLGQYRDEAFNEFKRNISEYREDFEKKISDIQKTKGQEAFQTTIQDARLNYREVYSQVNMTNEQLKAHGNERIADLMRQEINVATNLNIG